MDGEKMQEVYEIFRSNLCERSVHVCFAAVFFHISKNNLNAQNVTYHNMLHCVMRKWQITSPNSLLYHTTTIYYVPSSTPLAHSQ